MFFRLLRDVAASLVVSFALLISATASSSTPIIFDTDLGTPGGDIDDLGALAVLHGLSNNNEARILAVMLDHNQNKQALSAVDAVNTFYGRGNIKIGRRDGSLRDNAYNYADRLTERFSYDINADNAPQATSLYRQILAAQQDNSVVIVYTGKTFNLENLLNSGADQYSSLGGKALVEKKVKRIHIMGGHYPSSYDKSSAESNFANSGNCGTRNAVNNSPVPLVFNGFEVGAIEKGYATGPDLNSLGNSHPVQVGYQYWFQNPPSWAQFLQANTIGDWSIWDQIAVYVAVRGSGDSFGEYVYGYNDVACDGQNYWNTSSDKAQRYLTQQADPETFADSVIQPLMMSQPKSSESDQYAGIKRINDRWQSQYLSVSSETSWQDTVLAGLNADWWSQQWVVEGPVDGFYRLKNRWTNHYLTARSESEWDAVTTADLNESWGSQQWVIEPTGSSIRLRNRWTGLYLSSAEGEWDSARLAELRSDWSSQKWSINSVD